MRGTDAPLVSVMGQNQLSLTAAVADGEERTGPDSGSMQFCACWFMFYLHEYSW